MFSSPHIEGSMHFNRPYIEGSQVNLFIKIGKWHKVCKNFIEKQGVKVFVVKNNGELSSFLQRMRHKKVLSKKNSSKKSNGSRNSLDVTDLDILPTYKREDVQEGVCYHPLYSW